MLFNSNFIKRVYYKVYFIIEHWMFDLNGFVVDLDISQFSIGIQWKISKRKFKDILEFPPENIEQLKYSILEFIKSKYFHYPLSVSLFKS